MLKIAAAALCVTEAEEFGVDEFLA